MQDGSITPRIPVATYRLQFNRGFTFQQARSLVDYFHALGISDCYASPYFRARAESTHGYDIADHNSLNPAIGDQADYGAFIDALRSNGMGQVLDIVPNHMGIGESNNTWWMDVLENGPSSPYAPFFDIDWKPIKDELHNKVLLPILGQQYGRVLENGELRVRYEDGAFYLNYWEHELPINPRTYPEILSIPLPKLLAQLGPEDEYVLEYQSIITGLINLPLRTETDRNKVIERQREKEILKRRLATLCETAAIICDAVAETVRLVNGTVGEPRSFDLLDALIDRQAYRLSYWRVAAEEINYRRFFDINALAAIRMERPEVFEATHRLLLQLLTEGCVTGLRLDHPDGLWDPAGYFRRLQEAYAEAADGRQQTADEYVNGSEFPSPVPRPPSEERPLYIVVEKILGRGESLPPDWTVHGTTGYEFLNALNGVFVDGSNEKRFSEIYASFTGTKLRMEELVYTSKKQIMAVSLASELNVLAHLLNHISEHNRYYRDFTLNSLRAVIREVVACFPVYRTYIVAETDSVEERDRTYIDKAITQAKRRNPTIEPSMFDFLRDILVLNYPDTFDPDAREDQRTFVMKFQQFTGPVMAKGLEDTAFYIYNRLISLNEVGGEPQKFGISVGSFHRQNQERLRHWPHAMLTTSTHDTKRSEDVRARINVLSELPKEWRAALTRWSRFNRRKKMTVDGAPAPDRNEEYLLYQTLLGAWPFEPMNAEEHEQFVQRIQDYMIKAIREAKINTSWLNPNNAYDEAVRAFVAAILKEGSTNRFLDDFQQFQRKIAHFGVFNSLSQTLLKLTSPGAPDIYQGNEMWDFSLVDPDNRRPVDYDLRKWLLGEMLDLKDDPAAFARMLVDERASGRIKLYMTHHALTFRRDHAALFRDGSYSPLEATDDANDHIIAFARVRNGDRAITVVPRLPAKRLRGDESAIPLGEDAWGDTLLILTNGARARYYRNIFTGEIIEAVERDDVIGLPLAEVFANFPVALLERVDDDEGEGVNG
jgi:(1->4)-alpha-D-glucan 1-alpha-D-glucosylmutase